MSLPMLQTCGVASSCSYGPPISRLNPGTSWEQRACPLAPVSRASGAISSQGPPPLPLGDLVPWSQLENGPWGFLFWAGFPSAPGIY